MSNIFDELGLEMASHAKSFEHEARIKNSEMVLQEKKKLDEQQKTEEAKRRAIEERKRTLDWAWAGAELLNMSDKPTSRPDMREYTYIILQKRRFLGHKAVEMTGIAAYGWHLLDWQNTRYNPITRHTLILTPQDENNSGVYLRFFSEDTRDGKLISQLQPNDVHELPKEPLSVSDMPWPGFIDKSSGSDHVAYAFELTKKPTLIAPWQDNERSLTFSSFDINQEFRWLEERKAEMYRSHGIDYDDDAGKNPNTEYDYNKYRRTGTEKAIRRAIARVVAERLMVEPEVATLEIKRQGTKKQDE
jgi:hypothetical protein